MFRVSYMFSHAWPSLQSWSGARAMVASQVQLHWCHSLPGVVCQVWAWEVQAPRPLRRTTPTCSRCPSMSWSTTWHRLAAVNLPDDLRRLPEMPFRCGLCVAPLLWQPRFPRVLDVRQATRHCRTWHTVMVSRHSYTVCRDLWFYLWTLRVFLLTPR